MSANNADARRTGAGDAIHRQTGVTQQMCCLRSHNENFYLHAPSGEPLLRYRLDVTTLVVPAPMPWYTPPGGVCTPKINVDGVLATTLLDQGA